MITEWFLRISRFLDDNGTTKKAVAHNVVAAKLLVTVFRTEVVFRSSVYDFSSEFIMAM